MVAPHLAWRQRLQRTDAGSPQLLRLGTASVRLRNEALTELIRSFHVDHARALTLDEAKQREQARAVMEPTGRMPARLKPVCCLSGRESRYRLSTRQSLGPSLLLA